MDEMVDGFDQDSQDAVMYLQCELGVNAYIDGILSYPTKNLLKTASQLYSSMYRFVNDDTDLISRSSS